MNKLENLRLAAANFGLSPEDVVKGWYQNQHVRREFLQELLNNTDAEAEKIKPGMFYYAGDRSFSSGLIAGKQVSAIVGWVDESGKHGLLLGIRTVKLSWSSSFLEVNLPENADGRENTRLILEAARKQNKKAEAAEWCVAYDFDGICAGEAFLASRDELRKIFRNASLIHDALVKLEGKLETKLWVGQNWCWSSSGDTGRFAWVVSPADAYAYDSDKNSAHHVRCVLTF